MNKGPQEEAGTPANAEPVKQKQQTPEAPPVGESKPLSATEELRVKELAFEIAGTIKAKDGTTTNEKGELERSHDDVEYAALIYRDGDTLKATRLYTDNQTSQTTLTAAFAEAGGKQNVVGIVHNHPKAHVKEVESRDHVSESEAVAANRLPSEGDWDTATRQFGKRKDATHFILDPDGQLRAYDTEDRQKWLTHLKGPQVGPNKGNPDLKSPPALDPPQGAATPSKSPAPDQASLQSQSLYAQASERQLPSMAQQPPEVRAQMAAYATCVAAQMGWREIVGIGMNTSTPTQRGGELLCIAGKSDNPDPHANGLAVPRDTASAATPGEWLAKADLARDSLAQSQRAQSPSQVQDTPQPQNQHPALSLSRF